MTRVAFPCDKAAMKGSPERLKQARLAAGFSSASEAARVNSWKASTYRAHENGQNNFEYNDAVIYGKAFNANALWLCGFSAANASLDIVPNFSPDHVPSAILQQERAAQEKGRPPSGSLSDIATNFMPATGAGRGDVYAAAAADGMLGELSGLQADVPVYGTAMGGDGDEDFNLNGDVVNYVRRPHGIARMRGVFGIYVQGDSMSPRHRAGELRYVTSAQAPGIGDDIILEIFDENHRHEDGSEPSARGILKELVRRTSETYIVRQHNPPREFEIERSRIKRVFRVLTTNDLLG